MEMVLEIMDEIKLEVDEALEIALEKHQQ